MEKSRAGNLLMLMECLQGTFYDFVLYSYIKLGKEGTETSYTNYQVAVVFRMFLCIPKHCCIQAVELYMVAAIIEQGFYKAQIPDPFLFLFSTGRAALSYSYG